MAGSFRTTDTGGHRCRPWSGHRDADQARPGTRRPRHCCRTFRRHEGRGHGLSRERQQVLCCRWFSGTDEPPRRPCILDVLRPIPRPDIVIIDGYVWLDQKGTPGLGAHLWSALDQQVAVVGVAKSPRRGDPSAATDLGSTTVACQRSLNVSCPRSPSPRCSHHSSGRTSWIPGGGHSLLPVWWSSSNSCFESTRYLCSSQRPCASFPCGGRFSSSLEALWFYCPSQCCPSSQRWA